MAIFTASNDGDYSGSPDGSVSREILTLTQSNTGDYPSQPAVGITREDLQFTQATPGTLPDGNSVEWTKEELTYSVPTNSGRTPGDFPDAPPGLFKIPTGDLRPVYVTLEDQNGEPLEDALYVLSAGLFPTAARPIEQPDGSYRARLWLLRAAYKNLAVIGESQKPGVVEYYWYEPDENQDTFSVGRDEREVTVQFNKKRLTGLSTGLGVNLGGPLEVG